MRVRGAPMKRRLIIIVSALCLVGGLAAPSHSSERPGTTERIDRGPNDIEPLGSRTMPRSDVSKSGRFVTFSSDDPLMDGGSVNLVYSEVYIFDRVTRETKVVSTTGVGLPAAGGSSAYPSMSESGRFIAFQSDAVNLFPGDTNGTTDIFVHDRQSGSTELVTTGADKGTANGRSVLPSISATGRFIAFQSDASDLVREDRNEAGDVFLHDRKKQTTKLVSLTSDEQPGDDASSCPSVTPDGRFVAFTSVARNFGYENLNPVIKWQQVYVRDLKRGVTELISVASDGAQSSGPLPLSINCSDGGGHTISADGRYVAFLSSASNIVPKDDLAYQNIYVRDRKQGRTIRVDVSSFGEEATGAAHPSGPSLSRDGRVVAFTSAGNNLVARDTGTCPPENPGCILVAPFGSSTGDLDVFTNDTSTGATELASRSSDGKEAEGCTGSTQAASASATGRFVTFGSCSKSLQPGDTNPLGRFHLFLRDRGDILGFGGQGGPGASPSPDQRVCIEGICIPPGGAARARDDREDVNLALTLEGADVYGASIAYRPQYQDLFAAIELEYMPTVVPGISPIFYGLRFDVGDKHYEVRATSLNYGTLGLFDCSGSLECTKFADLRGGYGTTGMRVVFSVPLDAIGLENGGELSGVEAFSGIGSYLTGAAEVLDSLRVK